LQGFNPFNTLKYFFWYFIGILLLMICCFCLLSKQKWLLGLNIERHKELLRNRVGCRCWGSGMNPGLGYNGVCTASPYRSLHSLSMVEVCTASSTIISPVPGVLTSVLTSP
jgi:hypothetical protein